MPDPVRLSWEFHTRADIQTAWVSLSDTDRFNRVAQLGFTFTEAPDDRGDIVRVGHMKKLGLSLSWDELPFVYRAPHWFKTRRIFHSGPAAEFTATLRLKEHKGGGTDIHYQVEVIPRNALTAAVVAIELRSGTQRQLEKAFQIIRDELDNAAPPRDLPAEPLGEDAEFRLQQGLRRLSGPASDRLADFLRTGPPREQDRMSPAVLAESWGLPEELVTTTLIDATRAGLLAICWEVLCPSCRKPKAQMAANGARVHCPSCNIYYDSTWPDSLAVHWRPSPGVRDLQLSPDCIGSPAFQRHIVAQDEIPAGGVLEWPVDLLPGAYRIRTWPMRGTASLDVYEGALKTSMTLRATSDALDPPLMRAQPGKAVLRIESDLDRDVRVVVESRPRPAHVMTLGRLLQHHPNAFDLLPVGALHDRVDRWEGTALTVRGGRKCDFPRARTVYESAAGHIATYTAAKWAMSDLLGLGPLERLSVGVASGPILDVGIGDKTVPVGEAVEKALHCMIAAPPGEAATPAEFAPAELDAAFEGSGIRRENAMFSPLTGPSLHWLEFA